MSYDISLYVKHFLERALATNLGDWTSSDPIPEAGVATLVNAALRHGFTPQPVDPSFAEFLAQQGVAPPQEYLLKGDEYLAELRVYPGEIAFRIPYGDRAKASILLCCAIAHEVAEQTGLGVWDPQAGDAP